ncbi:MAG TPA: hypothetical protein VL486_10190 [Verrucomicrobiae bacterium]|nr:hypothetical protein [Verrucomicrobiae bacterium]
MMAQGIIVAAVVSAAWILAQNLFMHVRPAENRFKAMVVGYLLSLPFVLLVYHWTPSPVPESVTESPALGLFQAYLLHLLLFFCYAECFYHVERSVTLRLLVEILQHGDEPAPLQAIRDRYNVEGMIRERLEVLRENGFVERVDDSWRLLFKGAALARVTVVTAWVFQIRPQHERLDTRKK